MAMWPRVDVELVADYSALSPWGRKWFLRIHTDVPLDDRTVPEITEAMEAGRRTGDFTRVLTILSSRPPVSEDLRKKDLETQRTYRVLEAALILPEAQS